MNKQLARTLNAISQQLPKLIRGLELIYNSQANITIEKIDRPLLLTRGEIQSLSDFITLNPTGQKKELYISSYLALFKDSFTAVPSDQNVDFRSRENGMDVLDFLIERGQIDDLKAIVHIDLYQSFEYDPPDVKIHWFKIQVATPKDNKTVTHLIKDEVDRQNALKEICSIRQAMRWT